MSDSNTGISCGACGYRNRTGANLCNLCGGYLYARVAGEPARRTGTGPQLPAEEGGALALARRPALGLALGQGPVEAVLPAELDVAAPALPMERAPAGRDLYAAASKPAAPLAMLETEPEEERPARALQTPEVHRTPPAHSEPEPPSDLLIERMHAERAVRRAWKAVGIAFGVAVGLGLPASLQPVSLLLCGVGAVLYGFPVGYLVSRRSLGPVRGGALGGVAGGVFGLLLALLFELIMPASAFGWTALLLKGTLSGLVAGAWSGRRER
jgi:hypothetical protein